MKLRTIYLFAILLFLDSCKDLFEVKSKEVTNNLVVDGSISDGDGPFILRLSKTAGKQQSPTPLSGAQVSITDGNNNKENYLDLGLGKYQLNGNIVKGVRGQSYFIEIKIPGGSTYRSAIQTLPDSPQAIDSTYFKITTKATVSDDGIAVDFPIVRILLNSSLPSPNSNALIRWGVSEAYLRYPTCIPNPFGCPQPCVIFQPVSSYYLTMLDVSAYASQNIQGAILQERLVDDSFAQKHYFIITQYSMNKDTYEYWKKINALVSKTGSIFDTPPANISSNIYNINDSNEQVYGYFEASAEKVQRIGIGRGYFAYDIVDPCVYNPNRLNDSYTPDCTSCIQLPGATFDFPSWFQ